MRSKWHFSIILHSEFDSAYPKNPGKRSTNKVLPCLIRLTLTFMFWPLTSRNKVKMTSNQKPPIGFGFSTPENPRIRIFSKCIRKLAPQLKYEFYALTIVTMLSTILCKTVQLATQGHVGILYINTCSGTFRNPCPTWKFADFHYLQNVYGETSAIWCHFYVCYVISQHCSLIITPLCQMMCKFELLLCMLDLYNTLSL